jgi:hypothetical protein
MIAALFAILVVDTLIMVGLALRVIVVADERDRAERMAEMMEVRAARAEMDLAERSY